MPRKPSRHCGSSLSKNGKHSPTGTGRRTRGSEPKPGTSQQVLGWYQKMVCSLCSEDLGTWFTPGK